MNTLPPPPAHWPANAPNYYSLEGWEFEKSLEYKKLKRYFIRLKIDAMLQRALKLSQDFKGKDHVQYYKYHDISFRLLKAKLAL